jgi:hypothetical protein
MMKTHDPSVGVRRRHLPSFAGEEAKQGDCEDHQDNSWFHDAATTAGTSARTSDEGSLMRNSVT